MDIMSLDSLAQEVGGKIPPIQSIGSIMVNPEGFIMMNVKIPHVKGYDQDQIAIVMDDPGDEGLSGHPGYAYDLPSNGGNQGK